MKNKINNPIENLILDQEEQALERGEFEENLDLENTQKMLKEAVKQYRQLRSSKPITIRVNQLDLIRIKAKAKKKQIPYQTLLGLVLHEYARAEREISL